MLSLSSYATLVLNPKAASCPSHRVKCRIDFRASLPALSERSQISRLRVQYWVAETQASILNGQAGESPLAVQDIVPDYGFQRSFLLPR